MLIVAPLGLGMRLVTELTIDPELRRCGHGMVNDKLMRGVAMTFANSHNFGLSSTSWIRIIICLLTVNLRVRLMENHVR